MFQEQEQKSAKDKMKRKNISSMIKIFQRKKSAIEIQFNWIFVLIAGAVIFTFIISMIMNQKEQSENQISQDVIKLISTNIKGKQQLSNTYSEAGFTKTTFSFSCDPNSLISDFKISNSQRESLPVEIIFAPREFTASKLHLWTQDFSMPFAVTRFIYITTPDTVFVIYPNNLDFDEQLNTTLPENITVKQLTFPNPHSQLANAIKGFEHYKIICFDNCPDPAKYKFISIAPASGQTDIFSYGILAYNNNADGSGPESNYVGKASLLGAIFSDNQQFYECQMKRAFKQFELKRSLQLQRIVLLEDELPTHNPDCIPVLAGPKSILESMKDKSLSDSEFLYSSLGQLTLYNKDLVFQGCPLIY